MIVLKLGGSLITDKSKSFSLRKEVLNQISLEIREALQICREDMIIVHGGGSFGHVVADRYKIKEGVRSEKSKEGIVKTRFAMQVLNKIITDALIKAGIKAVSMQTSCLAMCMNDKIYVFNSEFIRRFIEVGVTPILYGDVVLDLKKGATILSGDDIVCHLAKVFNAKRVIFAIDKDGVFESMENRKLVKTITKENFEKIKFEDVHHDVTGSLKAKIEKLLKLAEEGYESIIVNGLVRGRIKKAILGEEVTGTLIKVP